MSTVIELPLRGVDDWGSGAYKAPRGSRKHKGIDYACKPGDTLYSPVEGEVTKFGYPYANALQFRYVEVTDTKGNRCRFFYVEPNPILEIGGYISENYELGMSQDVSGYYKDKRPYQDMVNHVHYEILDGDNETINPEFYHDK